MRYSSLPKQNMLSVSYRPGGAMSVIPCLTSFISDSFLSCLSGFNLESNSNMYNNQQTLLDMFSHGVTITFQRQNNCLQFQKLSN